MRACLLAVAPVALVTVMVWTLADVEEPLRAAGPAAAQEAPENPIAMSDQSVADGLKVYTRFCRSCHGSGGVGDGPGAPPDVPAPSLIDDDCFDGCEDGVIFTMIRNGVEPDYFMEPWEGRISDDDIWNIVNYLTSLKE